MNQNIYDDEKEFAELTALLKQAGKISAPDSFEADLFRRIKNEDYEAEQKKAEGGFFKKLFRPFVLVPSAVGVTAVVIIAFLLLNPAKDMMVQSTDPAPSQSEEILIMEPEIKSVKSDDSKELTMNAPTQPVSEERTESVMPVEDSPEPTDLEEQEFLKSEEKPSERGDYLYDADEVSTEPPSIVSKTEGTQLGLAPKMNKETADSVSLKKMLAPDTILRNFGFSKDKAKEVDSSKSTGEKAREN